MKSILYTILHHQSLTNDKQASDRCDKRVHIHVTTKPNQLSKLQQKNTKQNKTHHYEQTAEISKSFNNNH